MLTFAVISVPPVSGKHWIPMRHVCKRKPWEISRPWLRSSLWTTTMFITEGQTEWMNLLSVSEGFLLRWVKTHGVRSQHVRPSGHGFIKTRFNESKTKIIHRSTAVIVTVFVSSVFVNGNFFFSSFAKLKTLESFLSCVIKIRPTHYWINWLDEIYVMQTSSFGFWG